MDTRDLDPSLDPNRNTAWVHGKHVWIMYTLAVLGFELLCSFIVGNTAIAWTITNVLHTIITFLMFHWVKGSPVEQIGDQGKYDKLTFWEQLDQGEWYTPAKKFLTAVPVAIFLAAAFYTGDQHLSLFALNFLCCAIMVIAKQPTMDRVRIFGINKD